MKNINRDRKLRRKKRISNNILGDEKRPRISVFRSNKYIYVQAIDDSKRVTLASVSSVSLVKKGAKKITKSEAARLIGQDLANKLKAMKINSVVFDRGSYEYAGRVKALAEGIREGSIKI